MLREFSPNQENIEALCFSNPSLINFAEKRPNFSWTLSRSFVDPSAQVAGRGEVGLCVPQVQVPRVPYFRVLKSWQAGLVVSRQNLHPPPRLSW